MQLALDRFGRVVLPKPIRDDLGLVPGDVLDVREEGDGVWLRPVRQDSPLRVKNGVLVYTGTAVGDIAGAVQEQRQRRLDRVRGRNAVQ